MAYLPMPFTVRWCATMRLRCQATPTIIVTCSIYSRVAFISLKQGICAAFIRGRRLFEEIQYISCDIPGTYTVE